VQQSFCDATVKSFEPLTAVMFQVDLLDCDTLHGVTTKRALLESKEFFIKSSLVGGLNDLIIKWDISKFHVPTPLKN
jgi:hypothetical protein